MYGLRCDVIRYSDRPGGSLLGGVVPKLSILGKRDCLDACDRIGGFEGDVSRRGVRSPTSGVVAVLRSSSAHARTWACAWANSSAVTPYFAAWVGRIVAIRDS